MCGRFTLRWRSSCAGAAGFGCVTRSALQHRPHAADPDRAPERGKRKARAGAGALGARSPLGKRSALAARALQCARRDGGNQARFPDAFRTRRCLIPADGFYEWKALGKAKQPWYVHLAGDGLFAFAGLWEGETCTILTRAPTPVLAALHDRMPAVPAPANYAAWLNLAPRPPEELLALFADAPDWQLYPVRPLVNRATFDTAACIEPLPA